MSINLPKYWHISWCFYPSQCQSFLGYAFHVAPDNEILYSGHVQQLQYQHCFQNNLLVYILKKINNQPLKLSKQRTIIDLIFRNFATFYKILHSPQIKQWLISNIKKIVYELPREFRDNLRLKILENQEMLGKFKIWLRQNLMPSLSSRNKTFVIAAYKITQQLSKFSLLVQFYLFFFSLCSKYFVKDCLREQIFVYKLYQFPSNFNISRFFETSKPFSNF